MNRWLIVELHRSTACLPRFILRRIGAGAATQPIRMPGARILENVDR